jgi:hypothetical protein
VRRRNVIALSLVSGAIFSWGKLAYHCRRPIAEACVWGKAYMPFTFPVETVLSGAAVFAVWAALRRSPER